LIFAIFANQEAFFGSLSLSLARYGRFKIALLPFSLNVFIFLVLMPEYREGVLDIKFRSKKVS